MPEHATCSERSTADQSKQGGRFLAPLVCKGLGLQLCLGLIAAMPRSCCCYALV